MTLVRELAITAGKDPDTVLQSARELFAERAADSAETMAEFQGLLLALELKDDRLDPVAASHGILV